MKARPCPPMPGLACATLLALAAQVLAHGGSPPRVAVLVRQPPSMLRAIGARALAADPALALTAYRALLLGAHGRADLARAARLGIGKAWLAIGQADLALRYADRLLEDRPDGPEARALRIRALLRRGDFDAALSVALRAEREVGLESEELRAAHASALFRNRRLAEAEADYRRVLERDPTHVEALVRLGTGLLPPRRAAVVPELRAAIALQRRGLLDQARLHLATLLGANPEHPTALRLLGEILVSIDRGQSPLVKGGFFARFWKDVAPSKTLPSGLDRFFPQFPLLDPGRRRMIVWSARPFARRLRRVARAGGRHDILLEHERTTDEPARAWLRGRRTFDGRVWDDVRGVGGLCAATGVEALDDARTGGFQTLVHELAHQVHIYALAPAARARITRLYAAARRSGRCLDYYAASNEAEYFAQGVEAYFSLVKAAGQPVTHGHTRFELMRVDPGLAELIGEISETDPLQPGTPLLERLLAAALRVARARDGRTILGLLDPVARRRHEREVGRAEALFLTL